MDEALNILVNHLNHVQIPTPNDRVLRHECCITFDNPRSLGGLYIDMYSFVAFGEDVVEWNYKKNGNAVYLHVKKEGDYAEVYKIVVLPTKTIIPFPFPGLPEKVKVAAQAIIGGSTQKEQVDGCPTSFKGWDCANYEEFLVDYSEWPFFPHPGLCSDWIFDDALDLYEKEKKLSYAKVLSDFDKYPHLFRKYNDMLTDRMMHLRAFCRHKQLLCPLKTAYDLFQEWFYANCFKEHGHMKRENAMKYQWKNLSDDRLAELEVELKRRREAFDEAVQEELRSQAKKPRFDRH